MPPEWLVVPLLISTFALLATAIVQRFLRVTVKVRSIFGFCGLAVIMPLWTGLGFWGAVPRMWLVWLLSAVAIAGLFLLYILRIVSRLSESDWHRIRTAEQPAVWFDLGIRRGPLHAGLRKLSAKRPLPLSQAERRAVLDAMREDRDFGENPKG